MRPLKPIPADLISFPIRSDFPHEAGFTEALRTLARPNARGEVNPAMCDVLPPNLRVEDYHRIVEWAELPDRLAYYETNGEGSAAHYDRPIGVMLTCRTAILVPETSIWDELNKELIAATGTTVDLAGYPPWFTPIGASGRSPDFVLLHDRPSGLGYVMKASEVAQYLAQHLKWRVAA